MLSIKEKKIMKYILKECGENDTCLLLPIDIEHALAPKFRVNQIEVQALLDGLVQENYINLVNSDKNGELIYCISVLPKGKSFHREQHNVKKSWANAIVRTVLLAVLSFIVGIILKAIFS
jgi:DNA-binding MarR family transcriptional regulator